MITKIDYIYKDRKDNSILIRGWVVDPQKGGESNIIIRSTKEPVISQVIRLVERPDVAAKYPIINSQKVGFDLKIRLKKLAGTLIIVFKLNGKSHRLSLNLNTRYCNSREVDSPVFLLSNLWNEFRIDKNLNFDKTSVKALVNRKGFAQKFLNQKDKKNCTDNRYLQWIKTKENRVSRSHAKKELKTLRYEPLISIVVPVYNVEIKWLKKMIQSVKNQYYKNWELCIVDDASTDPRIKKELLKQEKSDSRIKVKFRTQNGHISNATNDAIHLANGEFVSLLDNDDELTQDALFEVVKYLNNNPETDLIYSDEDKIDENGVRNQPYFKSDYAPDSLLTNNYFCHFTTIRKSILDEAGGLRPGYEGAQDHDLMLRITEKTSRITHIPKILYHWRMLPSSTAMAASAKDYANLAGIKAVEDALVRRNTPGTVIQGKVPGIYRIIYDVNKDIKVSVITSIQSPDLDELTDWIDSIQGKINYSNYEIILINTYSPKKLKIISDAIRLKFNEKVRLAVNGDKINLTDLKNSAVDMSIGEYLLFLDEGIQFKSDNVIPELLGYCQLPWIGAVGGICYSPDMTIEQGGIIIGAGCVGQNTPGGNYGYFGKMISATDYTAVSSACMMVKRDKLKAVGGFDENITDPYSYIDVCCSLADSGFYNVVNPVVELLRSGNYIAKLPDFSSRSSQYAKASGNIKIKWKNYCNYDPMYNTNFERTNSNYILKL